MGTREADQELAQYIDDEDDTIRGLAIEAVQRAGVYTEKFLAELEDVDVEKRIRAATLLGGRQEIRAFPGLLRLLNDPASMVRIAGADGLGRLGNPLALDWLLPRLSDPESDVRHAVASSVIQMAARFDEDRLRQLNVAIAQVVASASGPEATEVLLNSLSDAKQEVRTEVARALGSVRRPEATAALVNGLNHTDPELRSVAARALAVVSRPEATTALIRGLEDVDQRVRVAVAQALATLGSLEATDALIRRLDATDPQVRIEVARALGSVHRPEATAALIRGLDDADQRVCVAVAQALAAEGSLEATEALIRRLDATDPRVSIEVARALGSVRRPEATDALISALNELMGAPVAEIRRTALGLRATSLGYIQRRLLSQDLDGISPWLDPSMGIDKSRIASAAQKLGIPDARVITDYEEINRLLDNRLSLNRSQETAEPSQPQATEPAQAQSLNAAVLRAVQEHPEGTTASEILSYLSREFGMTVRPNHLGISLQRHRRAGRLENRNRKWYLPQEAQQRRSNH